MESVHESGRWVCILFEYEKSLTKPLHWSFLLHISKFQLPSMHHSGTIGVFKFFPDDVLPLYVEKVW